MMKMTAGLLMLAAFATTAQAQQGAREPTPLVWPQQVAPPMKATTFEACRSYSQPECRPLTDHDACMPDGTTIYTPMGSVETIRVASAECIRRQVARGAGK